MYMTTTAALQSFSESNERKKLSAETMRYYRENLSRFYVWLSKRNIEKVGKITQCVVDDYLLFLVRSVPNKTSVNTYLRAVRRFVNYLVGIKQMKPLTVSLLKDTYKIKPTFSFDEVEKIVSVARPDDDTSIIMLVLLSTGMRSRSLCELRVRDVNFSDGYIDLHKTKSGVPFCLPISGELASVLFQYAAIYERADYLFLSRYGQKFNRASLSRKINNRLCELGIDESKRGVHLFRHTFGKIMSIRGCPTAILQKWLGHSDIKITQRYVDLYGNDLKTTMNMLPTSDFRCCK